MDMKLINNRAWPNFKHLITEDKILKYKNIEDLKKHIQYSGNPDILQYEFDGTSLTLYYENGKLIHSSESIPLNSILVNIIGATIGNCSKNGDEFKFNLNVEEDGSINLQIHAPNNKLNNIHISKLFDIVSDENNKLNSKYKFKKISNTSSKII